MNDPKYGYPYPAQGQGGYYQGPPVMAPPQYAAPPPRREPGFLEGWYFPIRICFIDKQKNIIIDIIDKHDQSKDGVSFKMRPF
ncbi:hypothetical protein GBA52_019860 [Prunus armeniaca]|nr:hypothetical protein GBA52_019860 [Prunus armeniaca]